jgi:hypothetical protein
VRVLRAPANNLTVGIVEDGHPVLLHAELIEEEEVADLEVLGDGEFGPTSFEDDLAAHLLDAHLPLAAIFDLHDHLTWDRA